MEIVVDFLEADLEVPGGLTHLVAYVVEDLVLGLLKALNLFRCSYAVHLHAIQIKYYGIKQYFWLEEVHPDRT